MGDHDQAPGGTPDNAGGPGNQDFDYAQAYYVKHDYAAAIQSFKSSPSARHTA